MGWFNRKPRDLIADSNAEWEIQRVAESRNDASVLAEMGLTGQEFQDKLIASGGWCAPSETVYDLFPEIQIKRGGIKWPVNPV